MSEKRDRETLIVNNSGSSAGWILAAIIAIVLAVGGWYILTEMAVADHTNISVDVKTPTPETPEKAPEAPKKTTLPAE